MKVQKLLSAAGLLSAVVLGACLLLSTRSVNAQAVVQSYATSGNVQTGMIVQQTGSKSNVVSPASQSSATKIFGVVVNPSAASVTLSSGNTATQTYVANSGVYDVLVSNQNGPIKNGDYVTISSIDGVGMKTDTIEPLVVGVATGSFDGKTNVLNSATLKVSGGKTITVNIGQVLVNIGVSHNPSQQALSPDLPSFLAHLAQNTAQKPVNPVRVYVGLVVLGLSIVIIAIMLYSAIRNSLVSIGRNPLSRHSIIKTLVEVIFTSLGIFIIALFAVYLLLKV